jgi:colanic acid biosynthesis glycosyl transferase WcaI
MGPIAALWAREMAARGHDVEVVAAHPHYPPDVWPQRLRPYREKRDGIRVLRLPLWIGHGTGFQRIREEFTYAVSAAAAAPFARRPDVIVAVSPAFLALAPTMVNAGIRRRPWVLWLQDILPDAAATTGLVGSGIAVHAARALERAAYRSAARIVVISDTFSENLRRKGVRPGRMTRIYNPATLDFGRTAIPVQSRARILYMGNMGYSQGLADLVRGFQATDAVRVAKLVIVGHGELAGEVRDAITSESVSMLGLVDRERLDAELRRASLGLVSQRADIEEFNVPSKLMTLMARGIPVLANVSPRSETARIVSVSGGGWVSDSGQPHSFAEVLSMALRSNELETRGKNASVFAQTHFDPAVFAERFEKVLADVAGRAQSRTA